MDKSVLTMPLPPALMTVASELARSNPAESGDPLTGMDAFSERRFTCSIGPAESDCGGIDDDAIVIMLSAVVKVGERKKKG